MIIRRGTELRERLMPLRPTRMSLQSEVRSQRLFVWTMARHRMIQNNHERFKWGFWKDPAVACFEVRVAGNSAKIRTAYLRNKGLERSVSTCSMLIRITNL
jgi:hypothetical protein